jgi:hypothetical protein
MAGCCHSNLITTSWAALKQTTWLLWVTMIWQPGCKNIKLYLLGVRTVYFFLRRASLLYKLFLRIASICSPQGLSLSRCFVLSHLLSYLGGESNPYSRIKPRFAIQL